MSTFLQLQDEVLAYGFDDTQYRTRVKSWINEAQSRIARSVTIPDLQAQATFSTVIGLCDYAVEADFIRILKVYHRDMLFDLNPVDIGELRITIQPEPDTASMTGAYLYNGVRGTPEVYCLFKTGTVSSINVAPVPDDVYLIAYDYYKRPSTLVSDGQTSQVPVDYHDLLVSHTLSRAYRAEDDAQMSGFYQGEYQRDLKEMAVDLHGQTEPDGPQLLPGTWGGY